MTVDCSCCGNYRLVEGDTGILVSCPDCHAAARCPVHGETVAVRDGVIVGRCWGCVQEAAQAEARIRARAAGRPRRVAA